MSNILLCLCLLAVIIVWLAWKIASTARLLRELPPLEDDDDEIPPRRPISSMLDPHHTVEAAAVAIRRSIHPIRAPAPQRLDGSDDEGSHSPSLGEHLQYPSIQSLNLDVHRLFAAEQLQQWIPGSTSADAKLRRRAAFRDEQQAHGLYRLSGALNNSWIFQAGTETFADHCDLNNELTRTWVTELKVTTKLLCLVWQELHEQNWQCCQQLKEELFSDIAGQPVDKLLEVALAFSGARWSAGQILQLLTIFDVIVDVLYSIGHLPVNISYQAASIYVKMVNAFRGMVQGIANDIHSSSESSIHPATAVLVQALDFFCRSRDMVESMLSAEGYNADPHSDMLTCWLTKLKIDGERIFQEKGQRYMFILNNAYYVWQMRYHPGGRNLTNVLRKLESLIEQYIEIYLDEYWFPPVLSYLDDDSLKKPHRSSLDKFTEGVFSICDRQMTWKVRTGLKTRLREKIVESTVPRYGKFFDALQANPSPRRGRGRCSFLKRLIRIRGTGYERPKYTAEQLAEVIRELFER